MLRVGIQREVPEDQKCVEKRLASPQIHHLQDGRQSENSEEFGETPMNSVKLKALKELNEFRELKNSWKLKELKEFMNSEN